MTLTVIVDGPEVVGERAEDWLGDGTLDAMAEAYTEPVPDEKDVKRKAERAKRIEEANEPFSPPYKNVMLMSKSGSLDVLKAMMPYLTGGRF